MTARERDFAEPLLRTALVVVNFGSHELLRTNLAWATRGAAKPVHPMVGQTEQPCDVVIVDNFKSAVDLHRIRSLTAQNGWDLVALGTNAGFGAGVNAGATRAFERGAEAIVIVNPDVALTGDDVHELTAELSRTPDALISPFVVDGAGRPWGRLGRIDVRLGRLWGTDRGSGLRWLSGACLAVHGDVWRKLGGMDPDYFMYWEDVDFSVRAAALGVTLRLLEHVVVVHDSGGTQSSVSGKSSSYYFYNCRNRLVFAAKLLTTRDVLRWAWHTPADVRRVVSRGGPVSRWARLRWALPPALHGSAAGAGRAISISWRRRGRRGPERHEA